MGAKQGRTKGNKQKAKYIEPERRHGKPGRKEGENRGDGRNRGAPKKPTVRREREESGKGRTDKLSSEMLKRKRTKESKKGREKARKRKQKGSTSGTAVGAKLGRTKGNKQEAEYTEPEGRHGKPGRGEGEGSGKRERNRSTEEASCEAETGREWKGRTDRLSSEMLKRKRTKGSGSQALIPEGKPEREAPVERLWERSREGRKETNRNSSMRNRMKRTGNQLWMKGRSEGDVRNRNLNGSQL